MDLVIEDHSRVDTIYFLMAEENVRKQLRIPWVSFGSDAASLAPEGLFLRADPHPRAYGNVARLLGKYVRDEKVLSLEQAVRRLSSLPAENLKLSRRGSLKPGFYADIVVFDPAKIQDRSTFEKPHQYLNRCPARVCKWSTSHQRRRDTGATPGQVVRGPGYSKKSSTDASAASITKSNPLVLPKAHAHNDYRHKHPLLDALDNGFCSVEADIYLVDGKLLVAHDRSAVKPERTLEALYLEPLRKRVQANEGASIPGIPSSISSID